MSNAQLSKLNESEMRSLVNVMVSAGNKRIRRLTKQAETGNIATEGLRSVQIFNDGKWETKVFSAKGKNRNELYKELARARRFFNDRLSNVAEATKERQRRERKMFGESREERAKRLKKEKRIQERREAQAAKKAAQDAQKRKSAQQEPPEGKDTPKRKRRRKRKQDAPETTSEPSGGPEPEPSREPEPDAQEDEYAETERQGKDWEDYYNSDEYDPMDMYKKVWEGFRYFLSGYGKELWGQMKNLGFLDSETVFLMISGYIAEGYDPREAGEKAAQHVRDMYADWQAVNDSDFYEV